MRTLRQGLLSERLFASSVLIVLGIGFLLAFVYLYAGEIQPHARKGEKLVEGVAKTYYGDRAVNRLESVLHGKMAENVTKKELAAFHAWIAAGATEAGYASVAPIVTENCQSCHDKGGDSPQITNYAEIRELVQYDTGVEIKSLAKLSHVHLLAIPLLFFMLGSFFVRTHWREGLKGVLVVMPFFGVLFDIAHWWITKRYESAALGIVVGGAMMGLGFTGQWVLTAAELWLPLAWLKRLRWLAGRPIAED